MLTLQLPLPSSSNNYLDYSTTGAGYMNSSAVKVHALTMNLRMEKNLEMPRSV